MHIEKTQDGYYWVSEFMRLPISADTEEQAQVAVWELFRSDFFMDRVHVPSVVGVGKLPVRITP